MLIGSVYGKYPIFYKPQINECKTDPEINRDFNLYILEEVGEHNEKYKYQDKHIQFHWPAANIIGI